MSHGGQELDSPSTMASHDRITHRKCSQTYGTRGDHLTLHHGLTDQVKTETCYPGTSQCQAHLTLVVRSHGITVGIPFVSSFGCSFFSTSPCCSLPARPSFPGLSLFRQFMAREVPRDDNHYRACHKTGPIGARVIWKELKAQGLALFLPSAPTPALKTTSQSTVSAFQPSAPASCPSVTAALAPCPSVAAVPAPHPSVPLIPAPRPPVAAGLAPCFPGLAPQPATVPAKPLSPASAPVMGPQPDSATGSQPSPPATSSFVVAPAVPRRHSRRKWRESSLLHTSLLVLGRYPGLCGQILWTRPGPYSVPSVPEHEETSYTSDSSGHEATTSTLDSGGHKVSIPLPDSGGHEVTTPP